MKKSEKEFVCEDAFIASRECKNPVICDICHKETSTTIRITSINIDIAWCENCKSIPKSAWRIGPPNVFRTKDNPQVINTFELLVEEFEQLGDVFSIAKNKALNELRKYKHEIPWDHSDLYSDRQCYLEDLDYEGVGDRVCNLDDEILELETDYSMLHQINNIIDFNIIMKSILSLINDEERQILAIIIEKYRLDELMTDDLINSFYYDLNTKLEEVKYNTKGIGTCLGYKKDSALSRYKNIYASLINKCKEALIHSDYLTNENHHQLVLGW